jgi:UDPglucose--hexose-1-phosphate uridylyltransferase
MRDGPHRRYNPLLHEWVLVSPQRLARPWQGRTEPTATDHRPAYDPVCYLCPGNLRAADVRNPQYDGTFVFDNDFPSLTFTRPDCGGSAERHALLRSEPEPGICRVVCFSPHHNASLPQLSVQELRQVVDVWTAQYIELCASDVITHVQIFENRGASMGASNPHPHGQIWATAHVPDIPRREQRALSGYLSDTGTCLLCSYRDAEQREQERIVATNAHFLAVVPFWAVWPYETMVLPLRHATGLDQLSADERTAFAAILKEVTMRYDGLFETACPYSMGIHQRPGDGVPHTEWHLHAHFFPPSLRSATVNKFMVGYELLASAQRDLTAETAAGRLRQVAINGAATERSRK